MNIKKLLGIQSAENQFKQIFTFTFLLILLLLTFLIVSTDILKIDYVATSVIACFWATLRNSKSQQTSSSLKAHLETGTLILHSLVVTYLIILTNDTSLTEKALYIIISMLPVVLLHLQKEYNYWIALANIVLILIGISLFSQSVIVFVFMPLIFIALIFNLNAAKIKYSLLTKDSFIKFNRSYIKSLLAPILPATLFASIFFLLFPRSEYVERFKFFNSRDRTSIGYHNSISFRPGSPLIPSNEHILSIEADDPDWLRDNFKSILLKGSTLETFTEHGWERGKIYQNIETNFNSPSVRDLKKLEINQVWKGHRDIFIPYFTHNIVGQNIFKITLSKADNTAKIRGGTFKFIKYAPYFSLTSSGLSGNHAYSQNSQATASLDTETLENHPYLQSFFDTIPEEFFGLSFYNQMDFLTKFFKDNYIASNDNSLNQDSPLEDFLLHKKNGHCEYFASATALIFRYLGYKSRIAVGYKGGQYNNLIDVLEVKERDAHAWVEVFYPTAKQWIPYDPTPPSTISLNNSGNMSYLAAALSTVNFWVRKYTSDYSSQTQKRLLSDLSGIKRDKNSLKFSFDPSMQQLIQWVSIVFLLAVYLYLRRRSQVKYDKKLPLYYQKLLQLIKLLEIEKKPPHISHKKYLSNIPTAISRYQPLFDRTYHMFEEEFYGGIPAAPADKKRLIHDITGEIRHLRNKFRLK